MMYDDAHTNRCRKCGCYDPLRSRKVDYSIRKPGYYWLHLKHPNHSESDIIARWVYGVGFESVDETTIQYVDERRIERMPP